MQKILEEQIVQLHKKYAASSVAFEIVFTHSQIVWEIAEELIVKNNLSINSELVHTGSLLHDIGAYLFIDKDGTFDEKNYIRHVLKDIES